MDTMIANTKTYKKALFIFRRDLRLDDNTGLIKALQQSEKVIPCFIFNPQQVSDKNKYKSNNAIQFMIESLIDLDQQLKKQKSKLHLFHDIPTSVVEKLIKQENIDAVFVNHDYTPYSIDRDKHMQLICKKNNVAYNSYDDVLLNAPDAVKKNDGSAYSIFTAFLKKAITVNVAIPQRNTYDNYYNRPINGEITASLYTKLYTPNKNIALHGGRAEAKKILKKLQDFKNYTRERDIPSLNKTTHLSAHLKFGTCSIREAHAAIAERLGQYHPLIRQLYWRDFFTHIAFHFPHVFGSAFHKKFNTIHWSNNKKLFNAWCNGKTGFPLVDAGMRQLNATGFMHNRLRMVVASFLTKDLHIDWRWGEHYFATKLVDYDPSVNNGNWQWAASTGCDAQPYFRIFNPWLQQKKFDRDCLYIKQWVPELKNLTPKEIHNWFKEHSNKSITGYPKPIVEHAVQAKKSLVMYKKTR
jgi:deoxyribodipyrimidine photo-lyase